MLSVGTPNEKLHRKSLLRQSRSLTRASSANTGNDSRQKAGNNGTSPVLHQGRLTFANARNGDSISLSGSCQALTCDVSNSGDGGSNVIIRSPKSSLLVELSPYNLFSILPSPRPTNQHTAALNLRWNKNADQERQQLKPVPLVIAGPSGSGKSTLLKLLMKEFNDCFGFSISRKFCGLSFG